MNSIKKGNIIKDYYKNRIQTPKGYKNYKDIEIFSDNKTKSTKKSNPSNKNEILFSNQNNINSINIINNNYNNIIFDSNKIKPNKNIILNDKNFGILNSGNYKEKSLKKTKALKLIFNQSNREKFNENKYQFIIDRLKNEIEYYKSKNKTKSNPIIKNSPQTYRKKGFKKNLFLLSNKNNTIKQFDNISNTDTNRENQNNYYNEKYNNNFIHENKLRTDFSYKNNLNINNYRETNFGSKSLSNNFITIDSNRTLKHMNKRPKINFLQNTSSPGINNSDNYISKDIIFEDDNNNGKGSFANLYNQKLYLNGGISSPLSLKKNFKTKNNIVVKFFVEEKDFNEANYKYKFENLKNRMNKLIGNLFDIIEIQKNKLDIINDK